MNNFKLLAIRPLQKCDPHILKILKTDQFYFFDNNYEPSKDQRWIQKKETNTDYIPEDFFFQNGNSNSTLRNINVQALVGKNGEGKSSLTELSLRIFNNFFKTKRVHDVTDKLLFVENLFAELYFLSDHKIYCICVGVDENGNQNAVIKSRDVNNVVQEETDFSLRQKLFFVINVNYSHYAFNSLDFIKETIQKNRRLNHSWLDKVFHRNDGYQTPLTVHPFRKKGIIDINVERDLINQRLITLILTEPSYQTINTDLEVENILFKKFDSTPLQNLIKRLTEEYEMEESRDTDQTDAEFHYLATVADKSENQYFTAELIKFIDEWTPPNYRGNDIMDYIPDHDENFQFISGTPSVRIQTFLSWLNDKGNEEITKLSLMCRAVLDLCRDIETGDQLQSTLLQYLCVKATKMLRYPQYEEINKLIARQKHREAIQAYLDNIQSEDSHVSIKFNQALHLLQLVQEFPDCGLSKFYNSIFKSKKNTVSVSLAQLKTYITEAFGLIDNNIPKIYLNPPGIFKKSMMLKATGRKEQIELSNISSGEYQKIGMLSSIIYHLTNIDSIQAGIHGTANRYEHVLLILDEIELYFHPDFQRTLLNDLLSKISQVNFRRLKAINILFVTHSPFVLSDIPKNNVLFIEDGLQNYPMSENTFGGNIHTLLQHGFFLKGMPIGEFAKGKINQLFNILNQHLDLSQTPDLEKRILMVSEPFLRSQLLKLYHERTPSRNTDILLKRITDLENIINDRNK